MSDINSMSRGNALTPNRRNSLPCTALTSRQKSCNQRVCCLLCSIARISIGWVFGQAQGALSGPLLWSGWVSSSSTDHRFIQIYKHIYLDNRIYTIVIIYKKKYIPRGPLNCKTLLELMWIFNEKGTHINLTDRQPTFKSKDIDNKNVAI